MTRKGMARVVAGSVWLALIFLLSLPGAGNAAPGISAEYLGQLSIDRTILWGPGRLTVANDGTLYVVDSRRNHVAKFDGQGSYTGDISVRGVTAVAAAPDGTLYVGSHQDFSVAILRNGKVAGHLGSGAREFASITDVAVDAATGNVYVADAVSNVIKVYSAAGGWLSMLQGLHLPMGVTVSGTEVYVLNAPAVADSGSAGQTTSAEIAVFDKKTGKFLRNFGDNGMEKCQIRRPTDIVVSSGLVYVTDAARQAVLVFEKNGVCLGEIQGNKDVDLDFPVALALSVDGTLYVSSNGKRSVQAFSIKAAGK